MPCPPNPVKAKKIAAMRKATEEMKNPHKVQVLLPHEIEAIQKEKTEIQTTEDAGRNSIGGEKERGAKTNEVVHGRIR